MFTPLTRITHSPLATAFRLAVIALAIYGGLDLTRSVLAQEEHAAYVPYAQQPGTLEERVAALEWKLQNVVASSGAITVTGANLWVVNGTGATDGETNGLGNVIVGYNELYGISDDRTGSHMLVVGKENNYSGFGGIVIGFHNSTSGDYASVSGGFSNTATGDWASVTGGQSTRSSRHFQTWSTLAAYGWRTTSRRLTAGEASTASRGSRAAATW